jgi:hypothetical protein
MEGGEVKGRIGDFGLSFLLKGNIVTQNFVPSGMFDIGESF